MSYVPLRLQSNWSLRKGGSTLDRCLDRAARLGFRALALTDENLFGAVPFFEQAGRYGIKPLLGVTLEEKGCCADAPSGGEAVLLVENARGYANLCRILTARALGPAFVRGGASAAPASAFASSRAAQEGMRNLLVRFSEGLILLTPDANLAEDLRDAFEDRVFVEIASAASSYPPSPSESSSRASSSRASSVYRGELPVVASMKALFAGPEDFPVHRLLTAFRLGKSLAGTGPGDTAGPNDCLRTPQEMARRFEGEPEALANTFRIAERCDFDLLGRETTFPRVAGEDGPKKLRAHVEAGARRRFPNMTSVIAARLKRELAVIISQGFADYFLVVEEIVRHARALGTPTAGRGSGAGSLVAYVLGITNVDPVQYDLPFERFLNEGRADFPDLDVDFCWRLRDDVIDYTYNRFGHDRVAMIATYATFGPRMALRESAKALGLSNPVITQIARKLRRGLGRDRFHTLPADPGVIEQALALAHRIEGYPHHLSVHCGGVVITPGPIAEHAPLLRAEKGVVITAFDKDGVERVGLVKLDLLGNRSLSTVSETVRRIEERTGERIDPEHLPENTETALSLLRSGRTVGCGQLESPAMRNLLVQMRPTKVLHIMQALALIRPGAAGEGMKETFIRRVRGEERAPPLSPPLARVLGEAYGVLLYEDDAMRVALALADFLPGEADRFRKLITREGDGREFEELKRRFREKCREQGMEHATADALMRQMARFKGYSFCRAHAASYGKLAYASVWLKAHYPLEYWTAALNNNEGMYPKWVLVEEARRCGVRMMPPCVNRSSLEFGVEGEAIRAGLSCVASLSQGTLERIAGLRPFVSLEDLVARVRPKAGETEQLIRGGALDFTGLPRNHLMWKSMMCGKKVRRTAAFEKKEPSRDAMLNKKTRSRAAMCGKTVVPRTETVHESPLGFAWPQPIAAREEPVPLLPDVGREDLWKDEWEVMGFTCAAHPMASVREAFARMGVRSSREIPRHKNRLIRLAGIIAAHRKTRTEKGDLMQFLTLDDEAGIFEVVLFPDAYARMRFVLDGPGPYIVEGVPEEQHGVLVVRGVKLEIASSFRY